MTLHDIEQALPPCVRFIINKSKEDEARVLVHDTYMGVIYDTDEGLFYDSQCDQDCPDDIIRRDVFLSYFNYELLLTVQYTEWGAHYLLYKLEPKFRVVYK